MIYGLLFYEFFRIGLFAIGGGLVTIPFLFELTGKYDWFTVDELSNMIAVSQSTPGPVGVNMATYAGFRVAGICGGIIATLGLVLPSLIIVIFVSKLLNRCGENRLWCEVLAAIRPAGVALILQAGIELFKLSVQTVSDYIFVAVFLALVYFLKKNPVFFIGLSAILGIVLEL